ncbi:hypothetical protein FB45DRAFT_869123 [Roridomyces roridus]|uniref:Uncharacterized protein n=1 Tax=Roridomyces roridus TaxID=1738132 RepID=A0AAD7BNT1_9AGAR|nr:hypothetical protein FB45DRAFT_869123 [Roridomyces roridus]
MHHYNSKVCNVLQSQEIVESRLNPTTDWQLSIRSHNAFFPKRKFWQFGVHLRGLLTHWAEFCPGIEVSTILHPLASIGALQRVTKRLYGFLESLLHGASTDVSMNFMCQYQAPKMMWRHSWCINPAGDAVVMELKLGAQTWVEYDISGQDIHWKWNMHRLHLNGSWGVRVVGSYLGSSEYVLSHGNDLEDPRVDAICLQACINAIEEGSSGANSPTQQHGKRGKGTKSKISSLGQKHSGYIRNCPSNSDQTSIAVSVGENFSFQLKSV